MIEFYDIYLQPEERDMTKLILVLSLVCLGLPIKSLKI